jgi:hypothetical protein
MHAPMKPRHAACCAPQSYSCSAAIGSLSCSCCDCVPAHLSPEFEDRLSRPAPMRVHASGTLGCGIRIVRMSTSAHAGEATGRARLELVRKPVAARARARARAHAQSTSHVHRSRCAACKSTMHGGTCTVIMIASSGRPLPGWTPKPQAHERPDVRLPVGPPSTSWFSGAASPSHRQCHRGRCGGDSVAHMTVWERHAPLGRPGCSNLNLNPDGAAPAGAGPEPVDSLEAPATVPGAALWHGCGTGPGLPHWQPEPEALRLRLPLAHWQALRGAL